MQIVTIKDLEWLNENQQKQTLRRELLSEMKTDIS